MAVSNAFRGKATGRVGNDVYYIRNGKQIIRELPAEVKNPRTEAQMQQRVKWANIVNLYRAFGGTLKDGFETKREGQSDFNRFMSLNLQMPGQFLTKAQAELGAAIVAPYWITQGSLPSIEISGSGTVQAVSNISLGSLSISSTTTIAEFSQAIVNNNGNWLYGDQLSLFVVTQHTNAVTSAPYVEVKAFEVVLDAANSDKMREVLPENGFNVKDGKLAWGSTELVGCFAWVHSRKSGGKVLVSSQILHSGIYTFLSYSDDAAKTTAMNSYGVGNSIFLSPDGEGSIPSTDSGNAGGGGNAGDGGNTGDGGDDELDPLG